MNLIQRGPVLECQSVVALGPDVLGFLRACKRKLNGTSVWCGLCLVNFFFNIVQMLDCFQLLFISFY